jgi:hypothetical protein
MNYENTNIMNQATIEELQTQNAKLQKKIDELNQFVQELLSVVKQYAPPEVHANLNPRA